MLMMLSPCEPKSIEGFCGQGQFDDFLEISPNWIGIVFCLVLYVIFICASFVFVSFVDVFLTEACLRNFTQVIARKTFILTFCREER